MKKYFILLSFICSLALTGCCTTHHTDRWEYQTLVIAGGLMPIGSAHVGPWTSDDATLNTMLKDGWKVAGYSVDTGNQWFLLKRYKHKE